MYSYWLVLSVLTMPYKLQKEPKKKTNCTTLSIRIILSRYQRHIYYELNKQRIIENSQNQRGQAKGRTLAIGSGTLRGPRNSLGFVYPSPGKVSQKELELPPGLVCQSTAKENHKSSNLPTKMMLISTTIRIFINQELPLGAESLSAIIEILSFCQG